MKVDPVGAEGRGKTTAVSTVRAVGWLLLGVALMPLLLVRALFVVVAYAALYATAVGATTLRAWGGGSPRRA